MGRPAPTDDGRRDDLVARLLDHLDLLCVTGDEGAIADDVAARYQQRGEPVVRVGDSLVIGAPGVGNESSAGETRPLILLVGHLDVVPPTPEDLEPRLVGAGVDAVVTGRGASDMKSGNVVAMRAFEDEQLRRSSPYDLALVLYAGEEGPAEANQLRDLLEEVTWLREAALAVVLEPTDGEIQLGCLGGLHARLTFTGRQAHSARPWHGRNALTKAGALLAELDEDHVREVEVDGVAYHDVWSATQAWSEGFGPEATGSAGVRNVIPGVFTVNLNLRFAPSRGLDAAEQELRGRVGEVAEVEIVDRSPCAPPHRDAPAVRAFIEAVGAPVAAKQAWTDVARFAEYDVPALNYGPGLTAQAHQRGEFVPVEAVVEASRRLERFLAGGA